MSTSRIYWLSTAVRGSWSAGLDALSALNIQTQPVIGLAKRLEEVYFPDRKESLLIPKSSPSLRLLQKLRNEAHRFAIEYNRKLTGKRTIKTDLENIPGIGPKKAQILLKHFGSVKKIKTLSVGATHRRPRNREVGRGKSG